ncbi:MAG: bifunctional oligoribonuclease/PAP phosphatase NrnA [Spirochaetes bacterium]|nr:bifunctional oligoribonuclease/PAP phosphatase NrnA [Spirochaetota bacterium]
MYPDLDISEVPEELVSYIKNCSNFIIAGHKEPDGDCVSSQLALRSVLLRMGKTAIVCSAGPFKRVEIKEYSDQFTAILPEISRKDTKVIIVDCSGKERTGDLNESLNEFPCAIIDHHAAVTHPPSTKDAPVYVDSNAPACAVLIYKIINALGVELTKEEASLLLFGICTDTGFFRHLTENNAKVFEFTAKLISQGASPKKTFYKMNGGKSLSSRILLGNILSRTESFFDGKLLLSYETFSESENFGFEGRDSDSLNQMLLSVENVEAVVIIRQELADNCTVSFRSIDKVDVAQIAASFGGGGHKNASGLSMKGEIPFVKQKVLEAFKNIFAG